jgi:hypothetical protein
LLVRLAVPLLPIVELAHADLRSLDKSFRGLFHPLALLPLEELRRRDRRLVTPVGDRDLIQQMTLHQRRLLLGRKRLPLTTR